MDKVKIQDIAAEASLSNAELVEKAKELGFDVRAGNSRITMEDAGILVDYAISGTLPKGFKSPGNKSKITVVKKKVEVPSDKVPYMNKETFSRKYPNIRVTKQDNITLKEIAHKSSVSVDVVLAKAKELNYSVRALNSRLTFFEAKHLLDVINAEPNSNGDELPKNDIETNQNKLLENDDFEVVLENKQENIISKKMFSNEKIKYDFKYKNILLKGVPGTGKSRTLENIINAHLNLKDHYDTNVLRINVHSASSNADLMQGIGISSNSDGHIEYKEKQGLILELIERATFNPNQPFVLVLEEIQENSLNELIGDLIYLIEDSKRAKDYEADNREYTYNELLDEIMEQNSDISSIKLPSLISKQEKIKRMIIPHNLYIFCTSNYRDDKKVIEDNLLRRFEVIEIYPLYQDEKEERYKNNFVAEFLNELNTSIMKICQESGEIHPDRFMIGHSIWLDVNSKKEFNRAFLKVITEFKDIKDTHFDEFKKITKGLNYPFKIEANYNGYEEWIKALQIECYDFLS